MMIMMLIRDLVEALPRIQQDAWREHFQERVEEVIVIVIIVIVVIIVIIVIAVIIIIAVIVVIVIIIIMDAAQVWTWMKQCQEDVRFW